MALDYDRKFPRRPFTRYSTLLYRGRTIPLMTYEIGEGGVGFVCSENIVEGHHAVINLFIGASYFGSLTGDVAFGQLNANTGQGYTVGFKFVNLPFEMKRQIREYISGCSI